MKSNQSLLNSEIDRIKKEKSKFDSKKEEFGTLLGELEATVAEVYEEKHDFEGNLKQKQNELARLQKNLAADENKLAYLKPEQELKAEMVWFNVLFMFIWKAQAEVDAKELSKESDSIQEDIYRVTENLNTLADEKTSLVKKLKTINDKVEQHKE